MMVGGASLQERLLPSLSPAERRGERAAQEQEECLAVNINKQTPLISDGTDGHQWA